jgi:hypothetical protein
MGIIKPINGLVERRRVRLARWGFNHELDAYARTLSRIERPAGETGGNPSMPMPQRAAQALPRLRRERAKFREACAEVEEARDAILRRLADPNTPADIAASARHRFDLLEALHPAPEQIAEKESEWAMSLARIERWAQRDPGYAAAMASRRAARPVSGSH